MARQRTKKPDGLTVEHHTGPVQYQVIRPLRISAATTLQPGARITPNDSWPHRRAKQFVDQGFLIPVPPGPAHPDTPVDAPASAGDASNDADQASESDDGEDAD